MFYIQSGLPFTIAIPQMGFFFIFFFICFHLIQIMSKKIFFIRTNV